MGDRFVIILQRLNFSLHDLFFTYSRDKWCAFNGWKKFKIFIGDLKVVNDIAERGVKLMKEFKDVLSGDEEQQKMLLHCVEDIRKLYLAFRKTTLAKKY